VTGRGNIGSKRSARHIQIKPAHPGGSRAMHKKNRHSVIFSNPADSVDFTNKDSNSGITVNVEVLPSDLRRYIHGFGLRGNQT
jgi:hypothetical protein